jgi:hypothetical protein
LRRQVVVDLVIGEPLEVVSTENTRELGIQLTVQWEEQKDFASSKTTGNLGNPLIIKLHPFWTSSGSKAGWLNTLPESAVCEMSVGGQRIGMNTALGTKHHKLESWSKNATFRFDVLIVVSAEIENWES